MMNNRIIYPRFRFRKKIAFQLLKKYFAGIDNFLEIGAGSGDFSVELSKKIKRGIIVDFSKKAIEELRKKNNFEGIEIINGDFLDIRFKEKYSLILMFDVLEHIKDDKLALRKTSKLLDKNGLFIFSVPSKMKKWSKSDELVGHYRRYEKKELKNLIKDSKLEIVKFYSYGFPVLNIVTFFSNFMFSLNYKKINYKKNDNKEKMSVDSGLGYIKYFQFKKILIFLINFLFSELLLSLYIYIAKPFNNFDLGDGYICLAKKRKI